MSTFAEQLRTLEQQMAQKEALDQQLPVLYEKRDTLAAKAAKLEEHRAFAQKEVERLEKGGIQTLFYSLTGKKHAVIKEAKQELTEVTRRCEEAAEELKAVNDEVEALEQAIFELDGCDRTYQKLCREKEAQVRSSDSPVNREIEELQLGIDELEAWRAELSEVIKAGEEIIETAKDVDDYLEKAVAYSRADTYDQQLFGNPDYRKYDMIKVVRSHNEALKIRCQRFQEVVKHAQQVEAASLPADSGWSYFRDVFIDDLFIDWRIYENLLESKNQITELKAVVWKELDKLYGKKNVVENEQNRLRTEIRRLINEA